VKTVTPITPVLGNVHCSFGLSTFFSLRVRSLYVAKRVAGKSCTSNAAN